MRNLSTVLADCRNSRSVLDRTGGAEEFVSVRKQAFLRSGAGAIECSGMS